MAIKALDGGRYKVDVRPRGRSGRRIQRIFKKRQMQWPLSVMFSATCTIRNGLKSQQSNVISQICFRYGGNWVDAISHMLTAF